MDSTLESKTHSNSLVVRCDCGASTVLESQLVTQSEYPTVLERLASVANVYRKQCELCTRLICLIPFVTLFSAFIHAENTKCTTNNTIVPGLPHAPSPRPLFSVSDFAYNLNFMVSLHRFMHEPMPRLS